MRDWLVVREQDAFIQAHYSDFQLKADCGWFGIWEGNFAVGHGRCCCNAKLLPRQRSLTTKFVRSKNCNYGFFTVLGNDGDLDLAFLNVENAICGIPLRKEFLILAIFGNGSSAADFR